MCFIACQGLRWFLECLKRDKDDDVALEFLKETQSGKEPVRTRIQKVSPTFHSDAGCFNVHRSCRLAALQWQGL